MTRSSLVFRWVLPAGLILGLGSTVAHAAPAPGAFTAAETLVSPQADLIDPEYSQARARITWVDGVGTLWIAAIDRATGLFIPANGKGTPIDTDAMTIDDLQVVGNGPEWLASATTDQIVYTKFAPGKPHTRANARLAIAAQNSSGVWAFRFLSPYPRSAPYASSDAGDPSPRISYVDPFGNHYWRNINDPASEAQVSWYPDSYRSMRFARGARATVFVAPVAGISQVFRYWLDTQVVEQLTFDAGNKDLNSVPWMWQAPELGNEFVFSTVVDDSELRIYRQLDKSKPAWSVIHTAKEAGHGVLSSPEPFTHNGRSYVFLSCAVAPNAYQSTIFLSNIDSAAPMFRQLTPTDGSHARKDPEIFVTSSGPYIYFNRFDPAVPVPGMPGKSEGIYRASTGLGPAQAR